MPVRVGAAVRVVLLVERGRVMKCTDEMLAVPWRPGRLPRIGGDTRKRKRRLRRKLEKRDFVKYLPAIKVLVEKMRRDLDERFLREIY